MKEWKNITSFLVLESLKRLSVDVGYMNGYSEFVWKGLSTHSFNFGYTRNL